MRLTVVLSSLLCWLVGVAPLRAQEDEGLLAIGGYILKPDGAGFTQLDVKGSQLAWPPDGTRLAFVRTFASYNDLLIPPGIHVLDLRTGAVTRVTNQNDFNPAWSPDGTRLAFTSSLDVPWGAQALFIVNDDGTGRTRLVEEVYGKVSWSPDGSRILYGRRIDDGIYGLHTINADGTDVRQLSAEGLRFDPAWSPDGTQIAFGSSQGLGVMNADGSGVRWLTDFLCYSPTWSADGSRIAFILRYGSNTEVSAVYVINADGSGLRKLFPRPFGGLAESVHWGRPLPIPPELTAPPLMLFPGGQVGLHESSVRLTFQETVQTEDAINPTHYLVESPIGTPLDLSSTRIVYDPVTSEVTISGLQLKWGDTLRVTISNVHNLYGVPIVEGENVGEGRVWGRAPQNMSIVDVSPQSVQLSQPQPVQVKITVRNNGTQDAENVRVRLLLEEKVVKVKTLLRLRPDEQVIVQFTLPAKRHSPAIGRTWKIDIVPLPSEPPFLLGWDNQREVKITLPLPPLPPSDEPLPPPPPPRSRGKRR